MESILHLTLLSTLIGSIARNVTAPVYARWASRCSGKLNQCTIAAEPGVEASDLAEQCGPVP